MQKNMASPRRVSVHPDRVINGYPTAHNFDACIDEKYDFDTRVKAECSNSGERRNSTNAGLKICKMIVIGDVSVGKTSMVTRFCKKAFDRDYKATIGVDFEVERFEILNTHFTLQMWDTAGQERFQCIAAAYYRGANAVAIVFDVSDITTLANARSWLEAALRENPSSTQLRKFLVGTKKDLVTPAAYREIEKEAIEMARTLQAEYWGMSSLTGENVKEFFFRVAALTFEDAVLRELEKRKQQRVGEDLIKLDASSEKHGRFDKHNRCCKT